MNKNFKNEIARTTAIAISMIASLSFADIFLLKTVVKFGVSFALILFLFVLLAIGDELSMWLHSISLIAITFQVPKLFFNNTIKNIINQN